MNIFTRSSEVTEEGIKIFSDKDFYWGVLERGEMQRFLADARAKGFAEARATFLFSVKKLDYLEDYSRADFHFLLPLPENAVILDVGSGYGNITIPLAKFHGHVVAVDGSLELLQYNALRAKAEGTNNVSYAKVDPLEYLNLPFAPKTFDAIVVSGLLEWVGTGKLDEPPQVLQEKVLKYLGTLLKDDGLLYVAIENRLFPGYLFRDPHSKLPYTAWLPKGAADWYARRRGLKEGYRTYIYSKWGYQRMFRKAGLPTMAFLYPYPGYRSLQYIYPEASKVLAYLFSGGFAKKIYTKKWFWFLKLLRPFRLQGVFLSSFMMIGSKQPLTRIPFLLSLLQNAGFKEVADTDLVIKVADTGEKEFVHFQLIRENENRPYATARLLRNPEEIRPSARSIQLQKT